MQQKQHPGRKWRHPHFFRRPRSTQEKRYAQDGWARLKRTFRRLPEARDDCPRHRDRCWKRHRKTQYKPKS